MREALSAWVDAHRDEMIAAIQSVLAIPSVRETETVRENAPFGQPIANALAYTLSLCRQMGMKTEDFQGYAGHAEFGAGAEIVAMLGHLDVVPPGKDWTVDPWSGEIRDGWLYGRGTSDDKGPTFAALFAAKAVLDVTAAENITLSRRIRLIFGCDEESDWKCMEHYFGAAGQPRPTVAFTPDSDFPLVYAEKGSFTAIAEKPVATAASAPLHLRSFQSGLRPNMVPGEAVAELVGEEEPCDLAAHVLVEMPGLTVERIKGGLRVRAQGISAHAATPHEGENAAVKLMRALTSNTSALDELAGEDYAWLKDLAGRGPTDGSGLDIAGTDGIGTPLTANLGVVRYEEGIVQATFNVRYPVTWNGEETIGRLRDALAQTGWALRDVKHTPSLYVPQDQEPVKTLLRVYREFTGDLREPIAQGGRTYATTVAPVGVAFGPAMAGDAEVAHKADERILIERLVQCAKIYAIALYELAK